jgi:hypothetical protein
MATANHLPGGFCPVRARHARFVLFGKIGTELADTSWHEPSREVEVSHLVHSLRHGSVPSLRGFSSVFHFVFDPSKQTCS